MPTDREAWSESSKRSYSYTSHPGEYKDFHYKCRHCQQPAVFTAEAQREAYEVRKAYIWLHRNLCTECFRTRMQIESELKRCIEAWQSDRSAHQSNKQFLQRWLKLLEDHVHYGGRPDEGNTTMLRRLLGAVA